MSKSSEKSDDPMERVREHVRKGTYVLRRHTLERQTERSISLEDVLYVLKHGFHEEEKSGFDITRQTWKYAIRGKAFDKDELRAIVAFAEKMAIITVMWITRKWL